MFIKWREANRPVAPERAAELRALRPAWAGNRQPSRDGHRFYAYLAKSVRVEGKPRQKVIRYLASIPAECMQDDSDAPWRAFWFKVYYELALVRISWRGKQNVCSAIGRRVHEPTEEELVKIVFEEWQSYPRWKKDYTAISRALEWADEAWALG